MKCIDIEVSNFRGIKMSKIRTENITAFVGQNNAGKSSFLRAMNAFFNFEEEKAYFENGSHFYSKKSIPKITLTLKSDSVPSELRTIFRANRAVVTLKYKNNPSYSYFSGTEWKNLSPDTFAALKKHIDFFLIPLGRDHTKVSGSHNSLIMQIVRASLEQQTSRRDEVSPRVKGSIAHFQNTIFPKIARELEKQYLIKPQFSFEISFPQNLNYSHVLHSINLNIKDGERRFSLEDCGSGIQSLTLIALFRLLGRIKKKNFILGLEEPEMNLHPQAQRDLISSLNETVASGLQVLLTTHSSVVVDQIDPRNVIVCRRSLDKTRGFKITTGQLPVNYWDKYNLDEQRSALFYRYKNSEFFFSKHILICEGKVDNEVIQILAERESINLNSIGVNVLNIDGIGSLKYPVSMFKELGIPHSVIVDKDFFFNYKNDELDESRDPSGYPQYKEYFNPEQLSTIELVFKNRSVRDSLKSNLNSQHTKALDTLENFSWICFKYTLEMDLINSRGAREHYFQILQTSQQNQNAKYLLVNCKKAIKKIDNICNVVRDLPITSFPHSYSRIKNLLKKLRDDIHKHELDIASGEANALSQIWDQESGTPYLTDEDFFDFDEDTDLS